MNIKTTNQAPLSNLPKVAEEGVVVAVLLAFLATAGLFYVNLGGAFLSAFVIPGTGTNPSNNRCSCYAMPGAHLRELQRCVHALIIQTVL